MDSKELDTMIERVNREFLKTARDALQYNAPALRTAAAEWTLIAKHLTALSREGKQ